MVAPRFSEDHQKFGFSVSERIAFDMIGMVIPLEAKLLPKAGMIL
jgi:hypothetical protein